MQPLRLFPQPGHATRTSPVRHSKRGLSAAEEGRERQMELGRVRGGVTRPPLTLPNPHPTAGGLSCPSRPAVEPLKAGALDAPAPPLLSRCISMPVDISGGSGAGGKKGGPLGSCVTS